MEFNQFGSVIWFSMIPIVFYVCCLYFTLTFFQHLKAGDVHLQKRSKLLAVISLAIALLAPILFNYFVIFKMSNF